MVLKTGMRPGEKRHHVEGRSMNTNSGLPLRELKLFDGKRAARLDLLLLCGSLLLTLALLATPPPETKKTAERQKRGEG
jgi:hypothetical protein